MGYHDERDPDNGRAYHTGRPCMEPGCNLPAGTAWSPYWCWKCNAERLDRITKSLRELAGVEQEPAPPEE